MGRLEALTEWMRRFRDTDEVFRQTWNICSTSAGKS